MLQDRSFLQMAPHPDFREVQDLRGGEERIICHTLSESPHSAKQGTGWQTFQHFLQLEFQ